MAVFPLDMTLMIELRCFRVETKELLAPFSFSVQAEPMAAIEYSELADDGRSSKIDRVSSCGESSILLLRDLH